MQYVHYSVDYDGHHVLFSEHDGLILNSYRGSYYRTWQDRSVCFWLGAEADND